MPTLAGCMRAMSMAELKPLRRTCCFGAAGSKQSEFDVREDELIRKVIGRRNSKQIPRQQQLEESFLSTLKTSPSESETYQDILSASESFRFKLCCSHVISYRASLENLKAFEELIHLRHPPRHPSTVPPLINMLRTVILSSARAIARSAARRPAAAAFARPAFRNSLLPSPYMAPAACFQPVRCYASGGALSKEEVTGRILDLLKNFDKVGPIQDAG